MHYGDLSPEPRSLLLLCFLLAVLIIPSATANENESNRSSEQSLSNLLENISNELQAIEQQSIEQSETIESLNESLREAGDRLNEAETQLRSAQESGTTLRSALETLRSDYEELMTQYNRLSIAHERLSEHQSQSLREVTEERDAQSRRAQRYRTIVMIGTPAAVLTGLAFGIFVSR